MIEGLSHITLVVSDLDRMKQIVESVLGGQEVYSSGVRLHSLAPEKFFLIGNIWLAIMQDQRAATHAYEHIAFKVDASDLPALRTRIEALGLRIREDRARIPEEGRSLYFYDDDGHLFELHSGTLDERLKGYARD